MVPPSRRTSRNIDGFTLNVIPEPLFHDEEISFAGVHIHNPLWDTGSVCKCPEDDEDPLFLPSAYLNATRRMMSNPQSPNTITKSSTRRFIELVMIAIGVVTVLLIFSGIIALTLVQNSAVWASPGILIEDDDVGFDRGEISSQTLECPKAWMEGLEQEGSFSNRIESMVINRTLSLCELEFANDCRCSSTLEPTIPKDDLSGESDAIANEDLDVVFLGDTLIENCARGLDSVSSNEDRTMERNGMAAVCHRLFRKDNGGLINGIALGASDDRTGHLLYRLQNDQTILETLEPKVWWIQIGSNDVAEDHCSAESIAWAVMPVIQEIKSVHANAIIVLSSIIPSQYDSTNLSILQSANRRLACVAEHSHDFQFFNSEHFLFIDGGTSTMTLDGMNAWGDAIVSKIIEITR